MVLEFSLVIPWPGMCSFGPPLVSWSPFPAFWTHIWTDEREHSILGPRAREKMTSSLSVTFSRICPFGSCRKLIYKNSSLAGATVMQTVPLTQTTGMDGRPCFAGRNGEIKKKSIIWWHNTYTGTKEMSCSMLLPLRAKNTAWEIPPEVLGVSFSLEIVLVQIVWG